MKSFVLDTSSDEGLLALVDGEQILFALHLPGGAALSKSLGAEVQALVDKFPPPYDRVVVGVGPGSFTGIRVGAAMAQALAFGWGSPLYTVVSLAAFAPTAAAGFAIAIDARSGGLYVQMGFAPPERLALQDAERLLSAAPLIASPHPSKILNRLPSLAASQWLQTRPCPLHLVRQAAPAPSPLIFQYLSTP